jgi:hypothetical protein
MPIFIKDNISIFYIHVPKTGGTYIEHFFKKNGFSILELSASPHLNKLRYCSPQHMHAEQINLLYNIKKFDYAFMSVRNPIFRLRSEFIMRNKHFNEEKNNIFGRHKKDINLWWKVIKKNFTKNSFVSDNHIRPQSEFYIDGVDIFKQEDSYDEVWAQNLESKIGLKFEFLKIPRRKNAEKNYGEDIKKIVLSDDTFEDVKQFYQADYEKFGYSSSARW